MDYIQERLLEWNSDQRRRLFIDRDEDMVYLTYWRSTDTHRFTHEASDYYTAGLLALVTEELRVLDDTLPNRLKTHFEGPVQTIGTRSV